MNFDLGPDERALQAAVRDVCARHFALADLRSAGMSRARWDALVDAGVFALRLPVDHGGLGLGMTHAVVVFEELGRVLVPGPIVETHVGRARGATEEVIGLIERDATVIDHLELLDVVAVIDQEGLWRVAPAELKTVPLEPPLDPFTPSHRIEHLPHGDQIVGADIAAALRLETRLLIAAQLVGIASTSTDLAVSYAQQRHQFGAPIGSFQAVKHLCAEMHTRVEVARAAVYAAACVLDEGGDAARAIASAKLLANEAAVANGKDCIQVHGGMGFTWEVEAHLYLKRAVVLSRRFGETRTLEELVAATQ